MHGYVVETPEARQLSPLVTGRTSTTSQSSPTYFQLLGEVQHTQKTHCCPLACAWEAPWGGMAGISWPHMFCPPASDPISNVFHTKRITNEPAVEAVRQVLALRGRAKIMFKSLHNTGFLRFNPKPTYRCTNCSLSLSAYPKGYSQSRGLPDCTSLKHKPASPSINGV